MGPPGPVAPADAITSNAEQTMGDGLANAIAPLHCLVSFSWLVLYPKLALR